MPLYDYKCDECGHHFVEMKRIADRKEPTEKPCPKCKSLRVKQILVKAPPIGDSIRMGRVKPPAGFNEVLKTIKKGNPGSNINIRD